MAALPGLQVSEATWRLNGARYDSTSFRSLESLGRLKSSTVRGTDHMTAKDPNVFMQRCPDCGARIIKRDTKKKHLLLATTYLYCKNPVCGASFIGLEEITHRLSPSSQPNPDVALPYAQSALRNTVRLALNMPLEPEASRPESQDCGTEGAGS